MMYSIDFDVTLYNITLLQSYYSNLNQYFKTMNLKKIFGTLTTICFASAMLIYHLTFPHPTPNLEDIRIYETVPNQYFSQYQPALDIGFKKPEVKTMQIQIDKSKMRLEDMAAIKSQLIQNHWRVIKETKYYFELCNGKNNQLSILFPTNSPQTTSSGYEFKFDNLNQWTMDNHYNISGIDVCEESSKK
ncbi:hypothetical protein BEN71_12115 [Acinetobacter wuhouensis]|uniref:hypothetical protein n=1 Tax=Acinetobacter wuhouensis TaxID=1879050 RepID=UPI00083A640D|nr:hypothetical protein [Acinetobacter wuhouensis]AXQ22775.1 hypothetical protein BEN71_12115 [Acinetobacter wuhouensis]